MGVDRPPTHIIEKRGTQLEGAIKCTRLVEKRWGTEAFPLQAEPSDCQQTIYGGLEMSHLLHIDSSVRGEVSVSRRLTARAADRWRGAHSGGTVTYRDLGTSPIPHLDAATGLARMVTAEQRTAAQDASFALSAELIDEIKQADTVLLGLPLYNFGPPSTVKAWVDHIIAAGLSIDTETHAGLLGDTDFIVLASRGGGYGPGTPREGWDHAQTWLPHALSVTGLQPRFITAELTTADANPKMSHLKPLAAESLNKALAAIDQLWTADEDAA
jgi:FMN-dependent NADH-azoreductase